MFNFDDNVRATIALLNRLRQKYRKIIIFAIYHSISFYRQFSPRPTSTIIARVAHTLRWRKLAACAQFKIQNSKFKILSRPTI